jgi:hypothetical protein
MAAPRQMQKGGYKAIRRDHTPRDDVTWAESLDGHPGFSIVVMNRVFVGLAHGRELSGADDERG